MRHRPQGSAFLAKALKVTGVHGIAMEGGPQFTQFICADPAGAHMNLQIAAPAVHTLHSADLADPAKEGGLITRRVKDRATHDQKRQAQLQTSRWNSFLCSSMA